MSENTTETDRDEEEPSNGTRWDTSRRTFMKAASAGAGALAFGSASMSGLASAEPQIPTPRLQVEGNLITDPEGNQVTLRGVNIIDPKRADTLAPTRGKNAVQTVEMLTDKGNGWHTHVVRIPIQPQDIGEHEGGTAAQPPAFTESELEDYLENHLDPVIETCRERGVYAIVDYHRHWHESGGAYDAEETLYWAKLQDQDPSASVAWDDVEEQMDQLVPNPELQDEVNMFWDVVAPRYADDEHVHYEVYNEPTQPGMWGPTDNEAVQSLWSTWIDTAQPWVDTIREHAPETLLMMGSPGWTASPEGALIEPFDDDNMAYTYHVYPGHAASSETAWGDDPTWDNSGSTIGSVHEEHPVVVTEFGWQNGADSDLLDGTVSGYGEPIVEWMEEHDGIHWTAWCADIWWTPKMFERGFEIQSSESSGHPYEDPVPTHCEELPCEWDLLGADVGAYDDYMGAFIKDTLEEYQDDGVPAGEVAGPGDGSESGDDSLVSVDLSADQIDAGDTVEATVSIAEIPRGLSGLLGDAGVSDPSVATVTDASINEDFGMVQDIEISDDGSMVNLVSADISGAFEEGDTDIELFTLELTGQGDGETEIVLEELIEAGDGTFYEFDLGSPSLTVGDGVDDGEEEEDNEEENDGEEEEGNDGEEEEDNETGEVTVSVDLSADQIDAGDTAEATVTISELPRGLSGLLGDAGVSDPSVATVADASINSDFDMVQDVEISGDGSMANLVSADTGGNFSEGDTDVELFTLTLEGQDDGEVDIVLEDLIEAGDGSFYDFALDAPSLAVGDGVDDGEEETGGEPTVTVDLSADQINVGGTVEATVSISELSNGLSGLLGDAGVSNPDAATVTNASINSDFDMVQDIEISEDGSMVNLVSADTGGNFSEGDTDVELFTLELTGQGEGDTDIVLENLIEGSDGTFYDFAFDSPTLSVDSDVDDGEEEDDEEETGDGPTVTADLSTDQIEAGQTAEVDVSISELSNGLSGLLGDAGVSNPDAATVTDATINPDFDMIQDIEISDDGSMVNLVSADTGGNFTEGDTDVHLFTLELTGQGEGETDIVLEDLIEGSDGTFYDFAFDSPSLTVTDETGGGGDVVVTADLSTEEIEAGQTAEVDVSISELSNGLSGLLGDAGVSNPDAATVTDATINPDFDMIQDIEISDDGSMVNLVSADTGGNFSEGDTDVHLFTLELTGQGEGDTDIVLEDLIEGSDGTFYDFAFDSPTLSVTGDGTGGDEDVTVTADLSTDSIQAGETAEAAISISSLPNGLSGLLGDAGVSNTDAATVTDATINSDFDMIQDIEISDDGSMVNLVSADTGGNFSEGDTDVELFTLELTGQGDGETDIVLEDLIEASDGTFYDFEFDSPTLSVTGDGTGGDDPVVTAELSTSEIEAGDTAEVDVSISALPNGLSGLLGDAGVSNPEAATVTDATINPDFDMIQDIEISDDGSMVNLVSADTGGNFSEGDTDVHLFTLELTGQSQGETDIVLEDLIEGSDGTFYDFEFDSPTLSVTGDGPGDVTVTADLSTDEIQPGETAEVDVSISSLPNGLSGLLGDAGVSNPDAATVVDATINPDFDMIQDIEISEDGSMVNLVSADTGGNFSEGDTDVELFTLTLEGQNEGETDIVLEDLIEASDGTFYDFEFDSPTLAVGGIVTGDDPVVTADLSTDEIDAGDTAEVAVSISELPRGLSGLLGDAGVSNPDAATVVDATINPDFDMIQDIEISDDGSMVNLVSADTGGNFSEGDTDVELFTLTLEGQGQGETDIVLENLIEASDGTFYDFEFDSPTLAVGGIVTGDDPVVTANLSADQIEAGETAEAAVSISELPRGLSGLLGDAGVSNTDAATVTDATINSDFDMIQDIEISEDGSMVNLVSADTGGNFSEGDTDVELFTLELTGQGEAETEIVLEDLIEAGDGSFYDFEFDSPTLAVTDGDGPGPSPDALVVDSFGSTGQWNELGRWRGGGSFQNGEGEIASGELVLEYDNAGWYASQVDEDVSEYDELVFSIRGDSGGEESDFTVSLGGANALASSVADSSVSTSTGDLRIDLDALGANQSSPGQLNLNFWQGGSSTVYIEEIRFE
ncbi:cellulase family glycosylhydrolase [Halomontanus rarus]|uniref:cellulase family glycosylhydrolase n=1 Tax=Halomontanus rarus TaxID=3034020 RepID=UPI001A9A0BAD